MSNISRATMDNNKCDEAGKFWSTQRMNFKTKQLLHDLSQFYTHDLLCKLVVPRSLKTMNYIHKFQGIERPKVSLRCLEWLVTNYSKTRPIIISHIRSQKRTNIFHSYGEELRTFKRTYFDPFCRVHHVYFDIELQLKDPADKQLVKQTPDCKVADDASAPTRTKRPKHIYIHSEPTKEGRVTVSLMTTVGQLNFLRWAYLSGTLSYAEQNVRSIQKNMDFVLTQINKEKKLYKIWSRKRKRHELSRMVNKYGTIYHIKRGEGIQLPF